MTERDEPHFMLPGSHERAGGPECRCGSGWDRWNDMCATGAKAPEPTRYIDVQVGSQFYADCDCGWKLETADHIQLESAVEHHTEQTGHIWPTGPIGDES